MKMIHSYHETYPEAEDKVGPWIGKRHGVPDGYIYVHHAGFHWIFEGTLDEVRAMFHETNEYVIGPNPNGLKNQHEVVSCPDTFKA